MAAPSNPYPLDPRPLDPAIVRSIRQASRSSGADFGVLMAEAAQESGFKSDAKAANGSAAGLYQFIDSTWLEMVHRFGAKYGLGTLSQQVTVDAAGRYSASSSAARKQILALRNDPSLAASLAGEYANQNKGEVEKALGRPAGAADLYMAHFLGAAGATLFLKTLATKGSTPAAAILPEAAKSNPTIFYQSATGRPKSVAEIYHSLGGRIAEEAQSFGAMAVSSEGTDDETASASTDSTRVASLGTRMDFGGLQLTPPVAAMLDTLTMAALRLADGATPAGQDRRPTSS